MQFTKSMGERKQERDRECEVCRDKMGCTSLLRSPKKEEQEVPNSNQDYTYEDFNILDQLEGVLNTKEERKLLPQQNSSSGEEFHWDFMEWEEFPPIGKKGEDENEGNKEHHLRENMMSKSLFEEEEHIKRENIYGFWEVDDEKMVALNLNLNYQEVLDAWSDRGSLWADECSLSLATSNGCYVSICHPLIFILLYASSSMFMLIQMHVCN